MKVTIIYSKAVECCPRQMTRMLSWVCLVVLFKLLLEGRQRECVAERRELPIEHRHNPWLLLVLVQKVQATIKPEQKATLAKMYEVRGDLITGLGANKRAAVDYAVALSLKGDGDAGLSAKKASAEANAKPNAKARATAAPVPPPSPSAAAAFAVR